MVSSRTSASVILSPEAVAELLVQPVISGSVASQVSTVIQTPASSFRVPVVTADPTAAWTKEGQEINPSDIELDEAVAEFSKLAGLSIITSELMNDSSPAAQGAIGAGLARDLSRKLDAAFFGNTTTNGPSGLASLAGVSVVQAGTAIENTDPFVGAQSMAELVGAEITHFVAHPTDALALAQVKRGTGSNEPLLQPDPTKPSRRTVSGVPLLVSPAVSQGTIFGVPQDRVYVAMREDAEVSSDSSVFYTSDRVAVRAKLRAGFAFPHEEAIVKIVITPAGG